MSATGTNRERGFTLIELLVGMAILIVVAAVGGDLIFNVIRSYNKSNILAEIEQNGNHAMSIMEQQIRNAASANIVSANEISLITHEEENITFSLGSGGTGCTNGVILRNTEPITNADEISGINITGLTFASDASGNVITVSVTLEQACNAPTRREFQVNPVTLTTTVVLRSSYGT